MAAGNFFDQGEKNGGISRRLTALKEWLWRQPAADEPWQHIPIRAALRIALLFFLKFHQDRITLRASALTFTIVLSLVPTLALGTAVLKGLGAGNQARQAAHRLIDRLEMPGEVGTESSRVLPTPLLLEETPTEETPPAADAIPKPEGVPLPSGLSNHLQRAVDQIFDYVDKTDFAALGAFGVIGLVLAVMIVLGSIESSMNTIWMAESDRPLGRRFMDYLGLMIVLPLAVNLALAAEAAIRSPALFARAQQLLPISGLEGVFLHILPLFLLVATFSTLYRFLPNTRVYWLPAIVGGLFGAVLWLVVQGIYITLQVGVARYNAIYGSFATLPLFLLWLQLCWIIFLAGAEMAFACQFWRSHTPDAHRLSPAARLALAFNIMDAALAHFRKRQVVSLKTLARQLRQPEYTVNSLLRKMTSGGLLLWVEGKKEGGYVPASPGEEIDPGEVVDLILGSDLPPSLENHLACQALRAARQAVAGKKVGTGAAADRD